MTAMSSGVGDTDGRCEELRRFRLIMLLRLQVVARRVQARQPLAYIICRLCLRLECGDLVFDDCYTDPYKYGAALCRPGYYGNLIVWPAWIKFGFAMPLI